LDLAVDLYSSTLRKLIFPCPDAAGSSAQSADRRKKARAPGRCWMPKGMNALLRFIFFEHIGQFTGKIKQISSVSFDPELVLEFGTPD
jgi:hypothetical protein